VAALQAAKSGASGYDDTAAQMYRYLEAHGVPYGGNVFEEQTAFPPDGYFLYDSGNEKMPAAWVVWLWMGRAAPYDSGTDA
jgi:hypothetical protein